jgi:YD repeat-containing protein
VEHGSAIEVIFADGDVLGAHASAEGEVSVYKNGALLGVRDVSSWPYYENEGYIGLWLVGANTAWRLDDFGGGSLGEQLLGRASGEDDKAASETVVIDWPSVTEWKKSQPKPGEEPKVTPVELLREGWESLVAFVSGLFQPEVVEASSGGAMLPDFRPMTLLEETAESVEITYTYDALNRLTAADYDTGTYFHYEYDAVGNRLEETKKLDAGSPEVVSASVYTNNKLSSITTASGTVNLTWDNNGNLLSDGENTYIYNHANQLTSFTVGDDVYEFTYNGLGDRVSQTKNGVTTDYALDQVAGLTQVLEESAPQGYESYTYLYGNGRIGQFTAQDSEYYLTDALGSVRQMVDGSGEITLTKSYEPYGAILSSMGNDSMGNDSSAYGYTGEMQDPSIGMVYLRSRYYSCYLPCW